VASNDHQAQDVMTKTAGTGDDRSAA
jgi:hypothetical protein